jgi:hypothetical protein
MVPAPPDEPTDLRATDCKSDRVLGDCDVRASSLSGAPEDSSKTPTKPAVAEDPRPGVVLDFGGREPPAPVVMPPDAFPCAPGEPAPAAPAPRRPVPPPFAPLRAPPSVPSPAAEEEGESGDAVGTTGREAGRPVTRGATLDVDTAALPCAAPLESVFVAPVPPPVGAFPPPPRPAEPAPAPAEAIGFAGPVCPVDPVDPTGGPTGTTAACGETPSFPAASATVTLTS